MRAILNAIEDHFCAYMGWYLLLLIVGLLALMATATYYESKQPHIMLLKSEWACTNTVIVPVTTYVKSGDVMVPIITQTKTCTQWSMQ